MSDLQHYNETVAAFKEKHKGLVVRFFPERQPFWSLASWAKAGGFEMVGFYLPQLGRLARNDGEDEEEYGGGNYGIGARYYSNTTDDQIEQTKNFQKKAGAAGWAEIAWTGEVEIKGYKHHIRVKSFLVPGGDGYSFGVLVATETAEGLAEFMHDLAAYDDARVDKKKRITIWRGGSLPRPTLTWDDLCVKSSDARELRSQVESFFGSKDKYAQMKLPYRRGFLLVGPPGNGKTTACKVIASQYPEVFFLIMAVTRQTDDNEFKNALSLASRNGPSVMLIEDLDKLNFDRVPISSFLNMLDGFETKEGVLILATSNEPQLLDKALAQRPSRFDRVFAFDLPDDTQRYELLKKRSAGRFDDRELREVAAECKGMSMAHVQEVVVNALLHAIHANREPKEGDLKRSLLALQQQQKQVKKIYDTGVPEKKVGMGFGAGDDDDFDPWDENKPVPGWRQ